MKQHKTFLSLVVVMAILFASFLSARAIDFVAEETYASVFIVLSGNSLGSGFAVGSNCVVTNAHVIDDPSWVRLRDYNGGEHTAQVVGMDEALDIAVLAVSGADFPPLKIADPASMNTGDDVFAIGAPKSMAYTLTKGVISAKERAINGNTYIQTDAPINEGNSGGPLLSASGEVLGMNTLKMNDSEGLGLAIPATVICDYLRALSIPLGEAGNVVGTVDSSISAETDPVMPDFTAPVPGVPQPNAESPSNITLVIATVAAFSITVNIILGILLILEKQKHKSPPADPRERTDFEIEILE